MYKQISSKYKYFYEPLTYTYISFILPLALSLRLWYTTGQCPTQWDFFIKMNKWIYTLAMVFAIAIMVLATNNHSNSVFADGTVNWDGKNGLDSEDCRTATNYIHWVFTPGGSNTVTAATLNLGGTGTGSYTMSTPGNGNGAWQVTTSFYTLTGLTASVSYTGNVGSNSSLVISDYCSQGAVTPTPTPTNAPTATPTPTNEPTATPTPTGIPTVTPTPGCEEDCEPTATPTPEATATPTPTGVPTATPTPGNSGCTDNCGTPNNNGGSSTSSTPTQAVLGASTMAATGTFTENLMNIFMTLGMISLVAGAAKYAKTKIN